MRKTFTFLAIIAVLAAGTSSAAMAKYPCAPGYTYHHRVCQPVRHLGYGNPVSGAVSGEAGRCGRRRGARHGRRGPYRHREYAFGALGWEG